MYDEDEEPLMGIKDKLYTDRVIPPKISSAEIAAQISAFVQGGGKIKQVPIGAVTLGTISDAHIRSKLDEQKQFGDKK